MAEVVGDGLHDARQSDSADDHAGEQEEEGIARAGQGCLVIFHGAPGPRDDFGSILPGMFVSECGGSHSCAKDAQEWATHLFEEMQARGGLEWAGGVPGVDRARRHSAGTEINSRAAGAGAVRV